MKDAQQLRIWKEAAIVCLTVLTRNSFVETWENHETTARIPGNPSEEASNPTFCTKQNNLPLRLTTYHAMKTYWRNAGTGPRILNFRIRWRSVVTLNPR